MGLADAVVLRPVTDADLDALHEARHAPGRWPVVSARPWRPTTAAQGRAQWHERDGDAGGVTFCVELGGRPVGTAVLWGIDRDARWCHLGVDLVDPAVRGRGVGTYVLGYLVRHAFLTLDLARVQVETLATNAAALGSARRAGFVEEARLRGNGYVLGERVDEVVLGLLRRDWVA